MKVEEVANSIFQKRQELWLSVCPRSRESFNVRVDCLIKFRELVQKELNEYGFSLSDIQKSELAKKTFNNSSCLGNLLHMATDEELKLIQTANDICRNEELFLILSMSICSRRGNINFDSIRNVFIELISRYCEGNNLNLDVMLESQFVKEIIYHSHLIDLVVSSHVNDRAFVGTSSVEQGFFKITFLECIERNSSRAQEVTEKLNVALDSCYKPEILSRMLSLAGRIVNPDSVVRRCSDEARGNIPDLHHRSNSPVNPT